MPLNSRKGKGNQVANRFDRGRRRSPTTSMARTARIQAAGSTPMARRECGNAFAVSIDGKAKITNQAAVKKYGRSRQRRKASSSPPIIQADKTRSKAGRPAGLWRRLGSGTTPSMPIVFDVLLTKVQQADPGYTPG